MQEPYRKGSSESILTSSLAGDIARCFLKRRQRHRWAGLLSCEKPVDQGADSIPSRRKAIRQPRTCAKPCAAAYFSARLERRMQAGVFWLLNDSPPAPAPLLGAAVGRVGLAEQMVGSRSFFCYL